MAEQVLVADLEACMQAAKMLQRLWRRRVHGPTLRHADAAVDLFVEALDGEHGDGAVDMHWLGRLFAAKGALVMTMPRLFRAPDTACSRDPPDLFNWLRAARGALVHHLLAVLEAVHNVDGHHVDVAAQLASAVATLRSCNPLDDVVPVGELPT